jgi:hypothetical protein
VKIKRFNEFYDWNPPKPITEVEQLKNYIYGALNIMGYNQFEKEIPMIDLFTKGLISRLHQIK